MNSTTTVPKTFDFEASDPPSEREVPPSIRLPESRDNSAALKLLDEWMADDSGYDEKVWPEVKQLIEENRLSDRMRFCE